MTRQEHARTLILQLYVKILIYEKSTIAKKDAIAVEPGYKTPQNREKQDRSTSLKVTHTPILISPKTQSNRGL